MRKLLLGQLLLKRGPEMSTEMHGFSVSFLNAGTVLQQSYLVNGSKFESGLINGVRFCLTCVIGHSVCVPSPAQPFACQREGVGHIPSHTRVRRDVTTLLTRVVTSLRTRVYAGM